MQNQQIEIKESNIKNLIYTIRDKQVMFDSDLARLYQVETRTLNQAVKRNIERFPTGFRFQLTQVEFDNLMSQFVISSLHGGRRKRPYCFTEQGVAMLSAVLKSEIAIKISLQIMTAFVEMRKVISSQYLVSKKFEQIDNRFLEYDENFNKIFKALENNDLKNNSGIFFNGQIFDAYVFVSDLIKSAKVEIILIDNYIDESVLVLLNKRNNNVNVKILTNIENKNLKLDLEKYSQQYESMNIKNFKNSHDRFLIIDNQELYHIGASLKDLGKKWFAFSRMDSFLPDVLNRIE